MNKLILVGIAALPSLLPAQLVSAPQGTFVTQPSTTVLSWRHTAFRSQLVYDSTHFTGQGVVGQISIDRIRFRAANGLVDAGGQQFSGVNVSIGTAAVDYLALGTSFASNQGTMQPILTGGTVTVGAATGTTPNDYVIDIPIPGGFAYNPTLGQDLVVDISASGVTGTPPALAAAATPATHLCRMVYNSPDTAAAGVFSNSPAIAVFTISGGPGGIAAIVLGSSTPYGTGCYDQARSFAELFPYAPVNTALDLGPGITLIPDNAAAPTFYTVIAGAGAIVPPTSPTLLSNATPPALMTDSNTSQPCLLPTAFRFPGGSTTVIHAATDGYVLLTSTTSNSSDFSETLAELATAGTGTHQGLPRLLPCWYDFYASRNTTTNPAAGMYFDVDTVGNIAYVTYNDVGEFATSTAGAKSYNFQVAMNLTTGVVEFRYGSMTPFGSTNTSWGNKIIGFTPGAPGRTPISIDLSASMPFSSNAVERFPLTLAVTAPTLGLPVTFTTSNVPATPGAFLNFISVVQFGTGFDMTPLGAAGCLGYMDPNAALQTTQHLGSGTVPVTFTVPFNSTLTGLAAYTQSFALDPSANGLGAIASNGVALIVGSVQ